ETIRELQSLESFDGSAFSARTNLAIRYHHRISTATDIFFPRTTGKPGYARPNAAVQKLYGGRVIGLQFPCDIDDQYIFLRFFIICDGETIKVEVHQNMKMLDSIEDIDGIKFVSEVDIALFKIMSAANRATQKDIYDLDLLSEKFPLIYLFEQLERKRSLFSAENHRTIFDLDEEANLLNHPLTLLKLDEGNIQGSKSRPHHSQNRVDIVKGQKGWPI